MLTQGTKLRQFREKGRFSQQDVADLLGITQSTYHSWESDKSRIKIEHLNKLALAFKVDPLELIPECSIVKIVNNTDNKENSVNGFEITVDAREMFQEIINSKNEVITAKDALIEQLSNLLKTYNL